MNTEFFLLQISVKYAMIKLVLNSISRTLYPQTFVCWLKVLHSTFQESLLNITYIIMQGMCREAV